MAIKYILYSVVHLVIILIPILAQNESIDQSNLNNTSCSELNIWEEWNLSDQCEYINHECIDEISSSILDMQYDQQTEYIYWQNAIEYGTLIADDFKNGAIEFRHSPESSSQSHALWEWQVMLNSNKKTSVTINMNKSRHELLMLQHDASFGVQTYFTKDLSQWDSETFTESFQDIRYIRIRSLIYNDQSDVIITLKQHETEDINNLKPVGIVVCILCIVFLAMLLWIVTTYRWVHSSRHYNNLDTVNEKPLNLEYILQILDNMKTGKFADFDIQYDQNNWAVWMEKFKPDWWVVITNECGHVFHRPCLKRWFRSI